MESKLANIWLDGYFTRRFLAGDLPNYSISPLSLQNSVIEEMEIKTVYLEVLNKNKIA